MPASLPRLISFAVFLGAVGALGVAMQSRRVPADAPAVAPPTTLVAQAVENALVAKPPYVAQKICDLPDERIDESSGLAASRRYPGCLWTHNDSGDEARLFLLSAQGKTLSEIELPGADARDWEDMAIAGEGNDAWVYVGDIGDNADAHPTIVVYRFREPLLDVGDPPAKMEVPCEKMLLTYPDAPHNAETLIAAPNGQLMIVTKNLQETLVFQTPQSFKAGGKQELEKLGDIDLPDGFRRRLTTGGAIAPDGKRLTVITYVQAHEWTLPGWEKGGAPQWSAIARDKPRTWYLPKTRQMEAVCYAADGKTLFSTSEQRPSPLFQYTPDNSAP